MKRPLLSIGISREIKRNLLSGTSKTGLIFSLFTCLLSVLVVHEVLVIDSVQVGAVNYQESGANIRYVSAEGRIDGAGCESLSRNLGISSAAIRKIDSGLRPTVMSSIPIEEYVASTGILAILDTAQFKPQNTANAGVLMGKPAYEYLLGNGNKLSTSQGELNISGVYEYPDDGRRGGFGYAIISPELVDTKPYDECWLISWPESIEANSLLNTVVIPDSGAEDVIPQISQLNTTLGNSFDGDKLFTSRTSKFNYLLALTTGLALGASSIWLRRLEFSSMLHSGMRNSQLVVMQILEQSIWAIPGAIVSVSIGFLISGKYSDNLHTINLVTAQIVVFALIGVFSGVIITALNMKERYLLNFLKKRE